MPPRDEIPADQLAAVIDLHYRGLGAMERYDYPEAARSFRQIQTKAPGWTIGTINLAIALLNQGGEAREKAKTAGLEAEPESILNIEAARRLLDGVIAGHPDQPTALFSRGVILRSQGDMEAAHRDFARVAAIDAHDANTWLEYGMSLTDPNQPGMPATRPQAGALIDAYAKALDANPYLVTAMYKLMFAYGLAGDRQAQQQMTQRWRNLNPLGNPASTGEVDATVYGEMGRYAQVIDPFARPGATGDRPPVPRFGPLDPIAVDLAAGDRWATAADFVGRFAAIGRARARLGAGVATCDVDRDGKLDLYLTAAVVGPLGLRDALLVNLGEGKFADRTAAMNLPLDRAGLGVAVGDFDADLFPDLYLTGINDNRLLHQEGGKFQDVTALAGVAIADAITPTARWFDLDQDGDLDLYVVNYAPVADVETAFVVGKSGAGLANVAFRNDGKPPEIKNRPENNWAPLAAATADLAADRGLSIAFSTGWAAGAALKAGTARHTGFAALDIDDDRDFDYVLSSDAGPPSLVLNDRAGVFRVASLGGWSAEGSIAGLLVADVDRDGHSDLVATATGGRVFAWRNATERVGSVATITGQSWPIDARNWRAAATADLDLDTWSDLVGLPATGGTTGIEWARNEAKRFANRPIAVAPPDGDDRSIAGFTMANLIGDPLLDLVVCRDGESPRVARNLGNGRHWLAVDLAGRWKTNFDQMRTNSAGLGTKLALEGQGLFVPVVATTPDSGAAQSVGPFVLGLGSQLQAPLLRIRWPDGVMQSELNVTADKTLPLVELNRKTGSCPILFTWNGERFVCLGDFAGAAGLGFLETPGEYHAPDRDEAMAIAPDQLRDVRGVFRLSVVEPMDEVAYLDYLTLDVVDRPPGASVALDERFAFGDDHPTGKLFAWTDAIAPIRAWDHAGRDVLDLIKAADRRSVDRFNRINGWVGFTQEHALTLDFGDRLMHARPGVEPVLCLTGWVEYPYSQTNYAAATAGTVLKPPVLEQQLASGAWQVIVPQAGHPAGLTRMMTIPLAGKLIPEARGVFRLTTNMECYWDQAFIAWQDPEALRAVRTTTLPLAHARLRDRGYLRESSPDSLQPILPDYDRIDPAPLARFRGELTRHGDVAPLLRSDDDHQAVMGPGDEIQLEFDGTRLPPLAAGWTRSFVFRSVAYCKDADPFTATSDSVGPLPWRGMESFPFPPGGERPIDAAYTAYLREYQTRPAGER